MNWKAFSLGWKNLKAEYLQGIKLVEFHSFFMKISTTL